MAVNKVLLHIPQTQWKYSDSVDKVLHNKKVNVEKVKVELNNYKIILEDLGIKVYQIDEEIDQQSQFNLMYCRDLFWNSPKGIVLGKMAPEVRIKEPMYAGNTFNKLNFSINHLFKNNDTFEGADALMLNDEVLIGIGHRTTESAAIKIQEHLDIKCTFLPCTHRETQHLLGALQVIAPNKVAIRHEIIDPEIILYLKNKNIEIINIFENEEVRNNQGMNFVVIDNNKIIMSANCPKTKALLEKNDIQVLAEVPINEVINGGGGLACLTGIIS